MPQGRMQIGEVADRVGLSQRTIRYYEEVGLVSPERTAGGFRLYGEGDVARLRLLKQMKPLEFTLTDMGDLLEVLDRLDEPGVSTAERAALVDRLAVFERQLADRVAELNRRAQAGQQLADQLRNARTAEAGAR